MPDSTVARAIGALFLIGTVCLTGSAEAGVVKAQVAMPADRGEAPIDGLWRIDNGVLPVLPRAVDPRSECLLLLQPRADGKAKEKEKKDETVTVELRGLRISPVVVAVPVGGTLEMKNEDRVPHTLYTAAPDETVVPPRPTPAGTLRSERMQRPGTFALLDDEMPHVRGWIVVTDRATALRLDEHGAARAELADGRYTLRLFYRGAYVVEREIDVGAKPVELQLSLPARGAQKRETAETEPTGEAH